MTLLATAGLTAFYGDFQALFGIDFELGEGEVAAVIGANGAGKSTFLRAIAGLNAAAPGAVRFGGEPVGGLGAHRMARLGVSLVPEGRRLFPSLSVEENLLVGRSTGRAGDWTLERIYALFPRLEERRRFPATQLSGGEQQMAAIGRALMGNPRLLLCDEISLGLAPVVVKSIYEAIPRLAREGLALVIVEQDIGIALEVAQRVICLQHGRVSLAGTPAELTRDAISAAYFGL
ncbi:MAG: ABC transporter ATP-binding protein [Burkholderiales bacterium]